MTEPTPDQVQELPEHSILRTRPVPQPQPGSPLYAPPISAEVREGVLERLERQAREHREEQKRVDQTWKSPEVARIRDLVNDDGNVTWSDFVKHCGGILEVAAMCDEYGRPDTDRIIPKVDELFDQFFGEKVYQGGVVFRRKPKNRPFVPGPGTVAGEAAAAAKRAGRNPGEGEAEQLLRQEQEERAKVRTTHPR